MDTHANKEAEKDRQRVRGREEESETCAKHRGEDDVFRLRSLVDVPDRGHGGEHL